MCFCSLPCSLFSCCSPSLSLSLLGVLFALFSHQFLTFTAVASLRLPQTRCHTLLFACLVAWLLVFRFQRWLRGVLAAGHAAHAYSHIADSELTRAIRHHIRAFQAWQTKDLQGLGESLAEHYKELLRLKASVSRHKRTRSEWHPHIDQQLQVCAFFLCVCASVCVCMCVCVSVCACGLALLWICSHALGTAFYAACFVAAH